MVLDFGIMQMGADVMFGLKVVALVMLYGYMHMNLGGGMLSTSVFAIFGYYMLFHLHGILSLVVLVLFYLMVHGFDLLWGGQMAQEAIAKRGAAAHAAGPAAHVPHGGPAMPPP